MTAAAIVTPSQTKTCTKCGETKDLSCFHNRPEGKFGVHSICRKCKNIQSKEWQKKNPEKARKIQAEAKRRIRSTQEGRDKLIAINQKYIENNREKVRAYYRERRKNDPLFQIKARYRGLLAKAMQRNGFKKDSLSMKILGCDWDQLRAHIEKQFTKGMSWDRLPELHLDHLVPMSTAKTEEDVIALSHFTNIRPMWAKDNMKKSSKVLFLL